MAKYKKRKKIYSKPIILQVGQVYQCNVPPQNGYATSMKRRALYIGVINNSHIFIPITKSSFNYSGYFLKNIHSDPRFTKFLGLLKISNFQTSLSAEWMFTIPLKDIMWPSKDLDSNGVSVLTQLDPILTNEIRNNIANNTDKILQWHIDHCFDVPPSGAIQNLKEFHIAQVMHLLQPHTMTNSFTTTGFSQNGFYMDCETYFSSVMPKFERTETTKTSNSGATLYQIKALKEIPEHNIKERELGGFIEHESNLSHLSTSWIDNSSKVEGARSRITGNSLVSKSNVIDTTVNNCKLTNCCYVKSSDIKDQDYDRVCIVKNNVITDIEKELTQNEDLKVHCVPEQNDVDEDTVDY